ncbi:MAG: hypothetical protein HY544_02020 [Candidatus Diapherotrites archaeon]|uniref:Uncharacterized protein n=1 Tax=Candidatus Iainarchaeum sp. TaxID=3101447 RepID=A0A8T3YKD9_9ARCH|nr:hypothetical protein [Candidatus Diapherotrites archaeon]
MRALGEKSINTNSPVKSYAYLDERIDQLQTRIRQLEQEVLEVRATNK